MDNVPTLFVVTGDLTVKEPNCHMKESRQREQLVLCLSSIHRGFPQPLCSQLSGLSFPFNTYHKVRDNILLGKKPYQCLYPTFVISHVPPAAPVSQSNFVIDSRALRWAGWWTACLRNTSRSTKLLRSFVCWARTLRTICASFSTTRSISSSSTRRASASKVWPEDPHRVDMLTE